LIIVGGWVSCNRQEPGIDINAISFTIFSPYGDHFITHYEIPFYAEDNNGNDITSAVTFYVNNEPLSEHIYIFSSPGNYTVTAQWNLGGIQKNAENTLEVRVDIPRHPTYVLIEDFTGTWCVNCPRVQYHLEELLHQRSRVFALAIHNKVHEEDPFHFELADELAQIYQITAYPTPLINREKVWNEQISEADLFLERTQPAGLKVESDYDGNVLHLTVHVRFDMNLQDDIYRLAVFASENNLYADQANATDYYGGQNPIPNMRHDHVLRHAFTSVIGEIIPSEECRYDNEFIWHYEGPLPENIADPAHLEFTAVLLKGEEKPIIMNVKQTPVNASSEF